MYYDNKLKWYLMDTVAKEPFDIIDFARYVYGDDMTNEQLMMVLTDELFKDVKISMLLIKSDNDFLTNDDAEALLDEQE